MTPFIEPFPVIQGFKERIDCLAIQGDRLFIGTGSGNIHIYSFDESSKENSLAIPVTSKTLNRRAIEQLGYIKDINSLVVLSDSSLTLYPLPDLVPPTPLPLAKKAFSFSVNSTVERITDDGKIQTFDEALSGQANGVPTVVTYLVVGCQRKIQVYSWRDGEAQEVKEAPLPHSARVITFIKPTVLCLAYSATEHVLFFIETMSSSELTMPINIPASTSGAGYGMSALGGLGGYMSLGLTAKAKPLAAAIGEDVLIPKDNVGLLFGADGKPKQDSIVWNAPPEDIVYVKPYILSIAPASTVPASTIPDTIAKITTANNFILPPVLQIHSSLSSQLEQSLILPSSASGSSLTSNSNHTIRLLTPVATFKAPIFAVSTPTERNAVSQDGSSIWLLHMRTWSDQINELVDDERYIDALALLDTIDNVTLPDKETRRSKIRTLHAVRLFKEGDFDNAINMFIDLDVNPAKVVALFPETVSGRLHVPPDRWIVLFGGHQRTEAEKTDKLSTAIQRARSPVAGQTPSPSSSAPTRGENPLDATRRGGVRENDTGSVRGRGKERIVDSFTRSVETLLRYLSDRRPKVTGALAAVHITPSQSHQFPFLSETSVDDLLSLPSAPLTSLTPEQLTRFAQIVDTALFKSYLAIRPALLGPLCRLDNWCEISEIEGVLQEREKYSELIFLYNGKKMHGKALSLLRRLGDKADNTEERVRSTVSYVQKLDQEYLDQIFEAARWVFHQDQGAAFEIFTSELTELPRSRVTDFLEELDLDLCARYLEYLISERDETSVVFHDRLAELYLEMAISAKHKDDKESQNVVYSKLLNFIQTSDIYRVDRLFGLLPSDDMFEARAILLGRLGRHEGALEIYVYRLHDYIKAEEYCKSIYIPESPTQNIFLSLLKIYLEPTQKQQTSLLKPALELISRQSPRIDTVETLRLLPPLVTAQEVNAFLCDAVRKPVFDTHVVREVTKGRNDQVARKLMSLQSNRVKVTDSRICPQCHKRLGNSVIAVHSPRGEVTHYQCREAFAKDRVHRVH